VQAQLVSCRWWKRNKKKKNCKARYDGPTLAQRLKEHQKASPELPMNSMMKIVTQKMLQGQGLDNFLTSMLPE